MTPIPGQSRRQAAAGGAVQAVLFDLDGTLIDSAPDLAAAANGLRVERGLAELPYGRFRPMVGSGARGMIGVAFGITPEHAEFPALRDAFLSRYESGLLQLTQVFPAMQPVLARLESAGLPWGIVTNKATRFAEPVVRGLELSERSGALVCGDTTAHAKPHPEPLREAARRLGVAPDACVYVGDDLRDVQAGKAAGMLTLAAAWGYLGEGEAIADWGADRVIDSPHQLLNWLGLD